MRRSSRPKKPPLTKDEQRTKGLALSYLIDFRPVVYWVVSVKKPWRGSWSSCTVHHNRRSAEHDLGRCREHFRRWAPWGHAYIIQARINI